MKKMTVILLVIILTLVMASNVFAASLVYLDVLTSGNVEKSGAAVPALNGEEDLEITILSGGTMFADKFKFGAEYGVGTMGEGTAEKDVTLWSVKGGYRVYDSLATKVDVLIAPLNIDVENSTQKIKLESLLAGLDITQFFSTKMFLTGTLVYSLDGSYECIPLGNDDSIPVSLIRLKFHYLVADNIALEAGYTSLKYSAHYNVYGGGDIDYDLGGINVGVMYKF